MLFQNKDGAVVVPQEGVTRKLMATGKDMMMTEVCVKAHVATPPHKHVHEQVSYIAKGSFDVICGEETFVANQGDSIWFPSNVEHGVTARDEDSIIIDIFNPIRKDFL